MNYQEIIAEAKKVIGPHCKVCPVCNGKACRGVIPGPGGKGTGSGFTDSYEAIKAVKLNMNTLDGPSEVFTETTIFGHHMKAPIFAGPVGAVQMHYSDKYNDLTYSKALLQGTLEAGLVAFTGDGANDDVFNGTYDAIKSMEGKGIFTIKPWEGERLFEKFKKAIDAKPLAIAIDIDAAGLHFLRAQGIPVGSLNGTTIKKLVSMTDIPILLKGILTTDAAIKAKTYGIKGIIVSNHGGRVLDGAVAPITRVKAIRKAVGKDMVILVDGAIRSGGDVFKALALGADGVLMARPFVTAVYGGDVEGVVTLSGQYIQELHDTMFMCGVSNVNAISEKHVEV